MKNQKGYVTLTTCLILVILIIINVFIGSKSSVIAQKSINNKYHSEVAFQNAEEGARYVMAALVATPALASADYNATPTPVVTATGRYTANYIYNGGVNPYITSTGYDSGNAQRTISQYITYTPGTSGPVSTPITDALTALGNATIGGNASISSIKAGGVVTTTGSARVSATTTSQFKVALLDGNGNELLDSTGHVVYRNMTTDEYFMSYFGNLCPTALSVGNAAGCKAEAETKVASMSTGYVCYSSCTNANLLAQYNAGKRIMWLQEGGMKINANVTLGSTIDPVLILVMNSGTVQINGTSTIYGVVFVDVPDQVTYNTCSCTATDFAFTNTYVTNLWSTINQTWSTPEYSLTSNANNSSACTVNACLVSENKCTPANLVTTRSIEGTKVTSSCSYAATLVSGTNNTPVEIDVLGTWDNSGGGHALIQGAAVTSGNFSTTGGIDLVKSSGVISVFETSSASVATKSNGWSDMH